MADAAFKARVDVICGNLHIPNPINENDLKIAAVTFYFNERTRVSPYRGRQKPLRITATHMNKAGRAYLEELAGPTFRRRLSFDSLSRRDAAWFFPAKSWEQCSRECSPLVFGCKYAIQAFLEYKL